MKDINVYDNFLAASHMDTIYGFLQNAYYRIGWHDTQQPQHRAFPNLHSKFTPEGVKSLNILNPVLEKFKDTHITKDNYKQCIINLTKPLDVNFIHTHPYNEIVALYYCNPTWDVEWGGETLFYADNRKDIRFANPYTPNRLIIFNGDISHTIKSQNLLGPSYRFSISLFFNKGPEWEVVK
tara:strand:- start:238 stop:780 length:543 start_codon:yes stop_codon:yes gene_type:complete